MKNTFLLFCSFFMLNVLHSQDLIIKNNGDTIPARITGITPDQVRYKRADFPNGPDYLQQKSDLAMIRYESGIRETFAKAIPAKAPEQYEAAPKSNRIDIFKTTYAQNGYRLPEDRLYSVLLKTKDPKIGSLVAESKKFKGLQYVGFLAIPLGIAGLAACTSGRNETGVFALGFLSIGSAITCPALSGIFKQKRLQRLNQAIELYNENY